LGTAAGREYRRLKASNASTNGLSHARLGPFLFLAPEKLPSPGIKPEMTESPQYGAILRHLEPFGPLGRL